MGRRSKAETAIIAEHGERIAEENVTLEQLFSEFMLRVVRTAMRQIQAEQGSQIVDVGPVLFDRRGAARYLGISATTLDTIRKEGRLSSVRIRGLPKFQKKDLDQYISSLAKRQ